MIIKEKWLKFLRHYGPIPRNDNMYDETILRSSRRLKIKPIEFEHPLQTDILKCFEKSTADLISVILTGTAGDGKTHLSRQVWKLLGGNEDEWLSDSPYLTLKVQYPKDRTEWPQTDDDTGLYREVNIHFIRDLSGWAPQQGSEWDPAKEQILLRFCHALFNGDTDEVFLIAANDGQLIESWRRLTETDETRETAKIFEDLLVEDKRELPSVRLKLFNLSRSSSAALLDRAVEALLSHSGWDDLNNSEQNEIGFWGPNCPIKHNYELLQTPLIQARLRGLLELCDFNGLHLPIRQILLLLTNALLGHPDVKDCLMVPSDVPQIISNNSVSKASLFNNIFGGNLSENRRHSITVFDYLERFQIGYETSNRIDNILIFGESDENLSVYFNNLIEADRFYGADSRYIMAKQEYIEGDKEGEVNTELFLDMLISQRRGLFFKIPIELEKEISPWELTVFKYAGEYLKDILMPLKEGASVKRYFLSRIVKGLNRVFTGMLVNSERELFLATSGNYSQAKVSRILLERVSVDPSKGEKIVLKYDSESNRILISVYFNPELFVDFSLTLIRFEFLSRIALEGALPASFSKECYEDLLAFKSKLISAYLKRREKEVASESTTIGLNLLSLTDQGMPDTHFIEVFP